MISVTYRGEQQIESGQFPVTFKNGQYRIWSGRKLAGQTPSYKEARIRQGELEDRWIDQLKNGPVS